MSDTRYRCERASSEHAKGLLALFESADNGCFCGYWHFEGDKNAWLERCYLKPELNRQALLERLDSPELCGVVALLDDVVCGWLKVTRASAVSRIYEQRVYKNLPYFQAEPAARTDVYAIGCLYVAEEERGRGAACALLGAAIAAARMAHASALEAFPRGAPHGERLRADAVWMGPEALFEAAGFAHVSDFRPYPVLRLKLD
jgi:hypothetical protein